MDLASSEDNTSVGEFARAIIEAFPKFKSFNIQLFNEKAGSITIDTVMRCVATCTFLCIILFITFRQCVPSQTTCYMHVCIYINT